MTKKVETYMENGFNDIAMSDYLVHDSPYMKVISFNLKIGQELPVHSHDTAGQVCIVVLEGTGEFPGKNNTSITVRTGDVIIADVIEPHGVRASSDMRILAIIAPSA